MFPWLFAFIIDRSVTIFIKSPIINIYQGPKYISDEKKPVNPLNASVTLIQKSVHQFLYEGNTDI